MHGQLCSRLLPATGRWHHIASDPVHKEPAFPRHPSDAPTRSSRAPTRLPANNSEAAWTASITAPRPPEYGSDERSTPGGTFGWRLRLASHASTFCRGGCYEVWGVTNFGSSAGLRARLEPSGSFLPRVHLRAT